MSEERLSRRKFLKRSGLIADGVGIAACGGLGYAATVQPQIQFPEDQLGGDQMNSQNVLIAYASKAGSTAEAAEKMGGILAQRGFTVDVMPVNKVQDLNAYNQVILGSAIRMGSVLPEMSKFIEANAAALTAKPYHFFVLCLTMFEDTPENLEKTKAFLNPIRALAAPSSEGLFAGTMNRKKLSLLDRLIANMVKAPEGDYRDWTAIETWTQALPLA